MLVRLLDILWFHSLITFSNSKFDLYIGDVQNGLLIFILDTKVNERFNNLSLCYSATSEALDDDDTDEGDDEGHDGATEAVTAYAEVKLMTVASNVHQTLTNQG